MLTDANLQELLDFRSEHSVLSVYVNTDPTQGNADSYKLELRNLLKSTVLIEDAAAIERYFEHTYDWSGRSVAIFSCAPAGFFRAYPLAVAVQSRLRVNNSPHVKPLMNLLNFYGGYGVALVDKQGARLFHFHLGELAEQEGVLGEDVHHTKRGGASSQPGHRGGGSGQTRRAEELVEQNMKEAAEFAGHFFSEKNVRRVVICGSDDNVSLFRSHLPKSWQSLVVGSFPMSMTAPKDEVLARTMEIGRLAEYRLEENLVETIITSHAKKHAGVLHLDATLKAVHEGRVQTLVIREGLRSPGYQCSGCEYVTAHPLPTCPFCGNEFIQIPDAVEMAIRTVLKQGGEIEMLQNQSAAERLGGIGAVLRY